MKYYIFIIINLFKFIELVFILVMRFKVDILRYIFFENVGLN